MHRGEQGSTVPFMALAIVLAGVTGVLRGRGGGVSTARAGARSAPDAAALAGAAEGRSAAAQLAEDNAA